MFSPPLSSSPSISAHLFLGRFLLTLPWCADWYPFLFTFFLDRFCSLCLGVLNGVHFCSSLFLDRLGVRLLRCAQLDSFSDLSFVVAV